MATVPKIKDETKDEKTSTPKRELPAPGRKLSNEEAMERTMKRHRKVFEILSE